MRGIVKIEPAAIDNVEPKQRVTHQGFEGPIRPQEDQGVKKRLCTQMLWNRSWDQNKGTWLHYNQFEKHSATPATHKQLETRDREPFSQNISQMKVEYLRIFQLFLLTSAPPDSISIPVGSSKWGWCLLFFLWQWPQTKFLDMPGVRP